MADGILYGPLFPKRGVIMKRYRKAARSQAAREDRLIVWREAHGLPCDRLGSSRAFHRRRPSLQTRRVAC